MISEIFGGYKLNFSLIGPPPVVNGSIYWLLLISTTSVGSVNLNKEENLDNKLS